MPDSSQTLIELETKFWQSMVAQDTDTALSLLHEPALMVSSHGAMQFDHAGYRRMAEQGSMSLKSFQLSDMHAVFPNDSTALLTYRVQQTLAQRGKSKPITQDMVDSSAWVREEGQWKCVMHTETPVESKAA